MGAHLTRIVFTRASPADQTRGLLGYVRCTLSNTVVLDGLTVRQTREGWPTICFPKRTDGKGRRHPIVRPLDERARRLIVHELIRVLRRQGHVA